MNNDHKKVCGCSDSSDQDRRSFCKSALALGMGAAALAVPVAAGAQMSVYPLFQKPLSGREYPITTLDNLDATPKQFPIIDDKTDAWITDPQQTIGTIFLRKITDEKGEIKVEAFQTVCPHAGCKIKVDTVKNPKTGTAEQLFFCPCHSDIFDLSGVRLVESPKSARDMDSLETRIETETGKVFVKFQTFKLGTSSKEAL